MTRKNGNDNNIVLAVYPKVSPLFSRLTKLIKFVFYMLLILIGVIFAVGNRTKISLTFFPFPYTLELPLFLFSIVIFAAGVLLGWMVTRVGGFKRSRAHKDASRRVVALENELGAIRTEQLIRQDALPHP